ncbi:MAG: flagellar biosynthesis/type III secretory pathway chaperone [Limisphaerales bacterium]
MRPELQDLIDALREELGQYGEVLALLEQQQELVVQRSVDEILRSVETLNREMGVVSQLREKRGLFRAQLALALALPEDTPLDQAADQLPDDERPLLQGLVREGRETLERMQHRARQNHLLIQRSMELMEQFIGSLFPDGGTPTYSGNGYLTAVRVPQRQLYDAVV